VARSYYPGVRLEAAKRSIELLGQVRPSLD